MLADDVQGRGGIADEEIRRCLPTWSFVAASKIGNCLFSCPTLFGWARRRAACCDMANGAYLGFPGMQVVDGGIATCPDREGPLMSFTIGYNFGAMDGRVELL